MKSISHIVTGIASAITVDTALRSVANMCGRLFYDDINNVLFKLFAEMFPEVIPPIVTAIIVYVINAFLFIIGCLLPDCDCEKSAIGRIIHIPVKHRTWTHTVWCLAPLILMGFAVSCFFWLAYGYLLHLFFDSLSKGGVCWFYPISQYKTWSNGAQVKKNHKFYLYRTGKMSETVTLICVVIIGTVMSIYAMYLTAEHGGLPFHAEQIVDASRV